MTEAGQPGTGARPAPPAIPRPEEFPDGQFYIHLRGYGPGDPIAPGAALAALLGAFGKSSDQLPADLDARAALWRTNTAAKRVLVVLDNARDTQQIRPLLPSSGCLTLVTSRTQLRGLIARDGARRVVLDRLDIPEAMSLLTSIVGADRVTSELADARRIVEVCARLPLAIRILGERVGRYPAAPLAEVVERIDNEHDRLAIFDLEDDEDTNLSAILTHSYRSLDADSATLFRLLGSQPVLDFTSPSAAAIAEISHHQARALLEKLATAHLLEQRRPNRYQFHDLMREFASSLARAQDGDRLIEQATRRLLDWYLHTLVSGDRQLNPDRTSGPPYPLPADIRPVKVDDLPGLTCLVRQ